MSNHHYVKNYLLVSSDKYAVADDMKFLIRESDVDREIERIFPLIDLFRDGTITIRGSKNFLETFESVDCEKMDLTEKLEDIIFVKFDDTDEIVLKFIGEGYGEEGLEAIATYDFTNKFLDDHFSLKKFAKYCLNKGFNDLLNDNINTLFKKLPKQSKQYRFLKVNDKWFLRALTSERYKNYDNHLAIYLTFIALDKYSRDTDIQLVVGNSYLTDSEVKLNILEESYINLNDDIKIQFGFLTSNNELTEGAFSLELRYQVMNENKEKFTGLSNYIFNFTHTISLDKLEQGLHLATNIKKYKDEVISFISSIYEDNLSENQLYNIFKRINDSTNKFKADTRDKARAVYDAALIDNTLKLIEVFDRFSDITTDVHERIYLERIYHELIIEIKNSNRVKTN